MFAKASRLAVLSNARGGLFAEIARTLKGVPLRPEQVIRLDLEYTAVTDTGLKQLGSLKSLRSLKLSQRMTGVGLEELRVLKNLNSLATSLSFGPDRSKFSDDGFKKLGTLTQLTDLALHIDITEVGVKELSKLNNLAKLDFSYAMITEAGWKELRSALPNCDIQKPYS